MQTNSGDQTLYGIILQNAETVALVSPCKGIPFILVVIFGFWKFWV